MSSNEQPSENGNNGQPRRPLSGPSRTRSLVRFMNTTQHHVDIIWLNYQGMGVVYRTLAPMQYVHVNTFVGHPWIFRDSRTGDRMSVQMRDVFDPTSSSGETGSVRRRMVYITNPLYSLRERCLQEVRRRVPSDRIHQLELPREIHRDLLTQEPNLPMSSCVRSSHTSEMVSQSAPPANSSTSLNAGAASSNSTVMPESSPHVYRMHTTFGVVSNSVEIATNSGVSNSSYSQVNSVCTTSDSGIPQGSDAVAISGNTINSVCSRVSSNVRAALRCDGGLDSVQGSACGSTLSSSTSPSGHASVSQTDRASEALSPGVTSSSTLSSVSRISTSTSTASRRNAYHDQMDASSLDGVNSSDGMNNNNNNDQVMDWNCNNNSSSAVNQNIRAQTEVSSSHEYRRTAYDHMAANCNVSSSQTSASGLRDRLILQFLHDTGQQDDGRVSSGLADRSRCRDWQAQSPEGISSTSVSSDVTTQRASPSHNHAANVVESTSGSRSPPRRGGNVSCSVTSSSEANSAKSSHVQNAESHPSDVPSQSVVFHRDVALLRQDADSSDSDVSPSYQPCISHSYQNIASSDVHTSSRVDTSSENIHFLQHVHPSNQNVDTSSEAVDSSNENGDILHENVDTSTCVNEGVLDGSSQGIVDTSNVHSPDSPVEFLNEEVGTTNDWVSNSTGSLNSGSISASTSQLCSSSQVGYNSRGHIDQTSSSECIESSVGHSGVSFRKQFENSADPCHSSTDVLPSDVDDDNQDNGLFVSSSAGNLGDMLVDLANHDDSCGSLDELDSAQVDLYARPSSGGAGQSFGGAGPNSDSAGPSSGSAGPSSASAGCSGTAGPSSGSAEDCSGSATNSNDSGDSVENNVSRPDGGEHSQNTLPEERAAPNPSPDQSDREKHRLRHEDQSKIPFKKRRQ